MKKIVFYILLSYLPFACKVDYSFDNKQEKRTLVVDGLVTTLSDASRIILSYTSGDFRTGSTEFVNNAKVTVTDEYGNVEEFGIVSTKGKYMPRKRYVAKTGKKYRLKIIAVDGTIYEAEDTLLPVAPILELDYIVNEKENLTLKDYPYLVWYYVDKQPGTNYYKTIQYRNGELFRHFDRTLVYDDFVLKDKNNSIPTLSQYAKNDTARIDLLSLSEQAYKFYVDVNNILNNDGGIFAAPAANPVSNISNGAMGFFQASDNSHREIIIKP